MADTITQIKIKDLPADERPYERLVKYGSEALSDAELIAIIIRTGSRNETSVRLAQRILCRDESGKGLAFLHDLSLEQLMETRGIGRVKAVQLKALLELSKRISSASGADSRKTVKSPGDIGKLFMEEMRYLKREVFKIVLLNVKNRIIKHVDISVGSLTASVVHPREVFTDAVKTGCSGLILVHNHPSGDPEPSGDDIETTCRLTDAGNIIGIKILDHIIIGDGKLFSFKDKGLI